MASENDVLAVEFDNYGGPEVLKLRRITPPQPEPGEVLIQVRAASMNPVDWKVRSGMLQKFFPVDFPAITGRDGAGEAVAAGSEAEASLVGKRVCFLASRGVGTWSQKIALPASLAVPLPATLSYTDAAALPLAGISAWIGMVQTGNVKAGMRVLIHAAAGGVGGMAVQIARLRGATVIATCSERNADFVRALGAQEVIAYDKTAFEDHARDVDLVFDVIGGDVHRAQLSDPQARRHDRRSRGGANRGPKRALWRQARGAAGPVGPGRACRNRRACGNRKAQGVGRAGAAAIGFCQGARNVGDRPRARQNRFDANGLVRSRSRFAE